MGSLLAFPNLKPQEFESACSSLSAKFAKHGSEQDGWSSADVIKDKDCTYLQILKARPDLNTHLSNTQEAETECIIDDDDDEEAIQNHAVPQVSVVYDIVFSPSYQVPVLYFSIKDPNHRFPPTMNTLYRHLVPAQYKDEVSNVGVIGGITATDHPVTNSPVFFIHPCQTTAVMESITNGKSISPLDYLTIWVGAMGKCVGLDVPIALAIERDDPSANDTT